MKSKHPRSAGGPIKSETSLYPGPTPTGGRQDTSGVRGRPGTGNMDASMAPPVVKGEPKKQAIGKREGEEELWKILGAMQARYKKPYDKFYADVRPRIPQEDIPLGKLMDNAKKYMDWPRDLPLEPDVRPELFHDVSKFIDKMLQRHMQQRQKQQLLDEQRRRQQQQQQQQEQQHHHQRHIQDNSQARSELSGRPDVDAMSIDEKKRGGFEHSERSVSALQRQRDAMQPQAGADVGVRGMGKHKQVQDSPTPSKSASRGRQPRASPVSQPRASPVAKPPRGAEKPEPAMMQKAEQQFTGPMAAAGKAQKPTTSQVAGMNSVSSERVPPSSATRVDWEELAETASQRVMVAVEQVKKLENFVDAEMKRAKTERIQNTLYALRNSSRNGDSVDRLHNFALGMYEITNSAPDNFIHSRVVFECSHDGLRLQKKLKADANEGKNLKAAVAMECDAVMKRVPEMRITVDEGFGLPVLTCRLRVDEHQMPQLIVHVPKGYPRKCSARYAFRRPPLGWSGLVGKVRDRFREVLAASPASSIGVAAILAIWAREAIAAVRSEKEAAPPAQPMLLAYG